MPSAAFETIRVIQGVAPFLERHWERLRRAALASEWTAPGPGIRDIVGEAVRRLDHGVLRVEWDGQYVGLAMREVVEWGGVRLSLADRPHRGYRHKSTDREWLDQALASALRHGGDEALFLTHDGWVAEGAVSAVGFVRRETVVFPPLDLGILPSIGRQRVIDLARELGVRATERRLTVDDVLGHPVFVVNAVRGVGQVVSIGDETVREAALVRGLARAFWPSG